MSESRGVLGFSMVKDAVDQYLIVNRREENEELYTGEMGRSMH